MNIKIPYKPHPIQRDVHDDDSQYIVLNWGRQTGKSTFVMNEILKEALATPKGRFWIVAPTYKQAKAIYWKDHVKHFIPKELVRKFNETELSIELVNNSTIELKGADNEDSLRGSRLHGVALDEYAFMKPHVWDTIISAMLNTTNGRVFFISTPNGFDHFHAMCEKAKKTKGWAYYHATSYDNPYASKVYIESKKLELPDDVFSQEYLADFTRKAGLVYKEFDKKVHIIDLLQPDKDWAKFVSIDFGQTNPTAVQFIGVDMEDNIYIYDEIYQSSLFTSELAHLIKSKIGGSFISNFYGDSAASQSIKDLSEKGIFVLPVKKRQGTTTEDYFKAGIEKIRGYLKIQEGTGKPKMFVAGNCINTINEFESYSWKEVKEGDVRNKSERPEKSYDHCFDDKTEILTNQGWKYFKDLNKSEQVATIDKNYKLAWQKPSAYQINKYNGELLVSNGQVEFAVTPDHNLIIVSQTNHKKLKNDTFEWTPAQDIKTKVWVPKTCEPEQKNDFKLIDPYLLGFYIAEGCKSLSRGKKYVHFDQKSKKVLKRMFDTAGIKKYSFSRNGSAYRVSLRSDELYDSLPAGMCFEKRIPREFLNNASHRELMECYRGMMDGDGSWGRFKHYTTTSKGLADDFQELLVRIGKNGKISKIEEDRNGLAFGRTVRLRAVYRVTIRSDNSVAGRFSELNPNKIKRELYSGTTYCVTVPNHTICVRRNGRVMWSGQCMDALRYFIYEHMKEAEPTYVPKTTGFGGTEIGGYVI